MSKHRSHRLQELIVTLINTPIIAFYFFSFFLPNISITPIGNVLLLYFGSIILFVLPIGAFTGYALNSFENSIKISIVSTFTGYFLSFVYYSFPFFFGVTAFDYSAYYFLYIQFTFLLFFFILIFMFLGAIIGSYFQDRYYAKRSHNQA
ncbi:MAG: hypothetical protein ACP5TO_01815 [Thermoplasmata archaeon]